MCSNVNLVATVRYLYIWLSMVELILKNLKKNLGGIASSNMFAKHACVHHPLGDTSLTHHCMLHYSIYG